jgi:hypothetical protein
MADSLTGTPDEVAMCIACCLDSPVDLLRLGVACRQFRLKTVPSPPAHPPGSGVAGDGPAAGAAPPEMWSVASEVARRWIAARSAQHRGWVPRRPQDCWLGLMAELQRLLWSAVFVRAPPWRDAVQVAITHSWRPTLAAFPECWRLSVATKNGPSVPGQSVPVATAVAMRAGRHFARFTVMRGEDMLFGLVRPGYDVDGGAITEDVDGHCFYDVSNGDLWPGPRSWEGQGWTEGGEEGDTIGMLLDFDDGTLTIFRDEAAGLERLGVMARGLSGEYCWAVSMWPRGHSAQLESPVCAPVQDAVSGEWRW